LLSQLAMSHAYAREHAPRVAVVGYSAVPIAAVLDACVWGVLPGVATVLGAIAMVAAGAMLVRRR
jgi:drug/metabolite transporter (DMT)-like permease